MIFIFHKRSYHANNKKTKQRIKGLPTVDKRNKMATPFVTRGKTRRRRNKAKNEQTGLF